VGGRFVCDPSQHARTIRWGAIFGKGFLPNIISTKQKLNTRSSTKTELVGADDFMLKDTNYTTMPCFRITKMVGLQAASLQNTSGFDISSSLIESTREIEFDLCPTTGLIGDFMSNTLQGKLFRKFGDPIMRATPIRSGRLHRLVWCARKGGTTGIYWEPAKYVGRTDVPHTLTVLGR
jgi:hypothetical protein